MFIKEIEKYGADGKKYTYYRLCESIRIGDKTRHNNLLRTVSISDITLNGTSTGTISGNVTQQNSGINWDGVASNFVLGVAEGVGAFDLGGDSKVSTNFANVATSALSGNILGVFDALTGGNSTSNYEVDLKINSTITATGTLTQSQPLSPNSIVVPGQTVANTVGAPIPIYNSPLGVFNFPNRPTVHITSKKSTAPPSWDGPANAYYVNTLTLDPSFVSSIQKNPVVLNLATVSIQSTQVLLENFDAGNYFYSYPQITETVGNISVTDNNIIDGNQLTPGQISTAVVRVIVSVKPNNGTTPPVTILKSFVANVVTP